MADRASRTIEALEYDSIAAKNATYLSAILARLPCSASIDAAAIGADALALVVAAKRMRANILANPSGARTGAPKSAVRAAQRYGLQLVPKRDAKGYVLGLALPSDAYNSAFGSVFPLA